mmetsp:Transcript_3840/g.11095  ORF Transcript_3840/g.11095 Transcript_3840/m.11095 type:complete len:454 (+) Transcript_3840:3867-5228(+)
MENGLRGAVGTLSEDDEEGTAKAVALSSGEGLPPILCQLLTLQGDDLLQKVVGCIATGKAHWGFSEDRLCLKSELVGNGLRVRTQLLRSCDAPLAGPALGEWLCELLQRLEESNDSVEAFGALLPPCSRAGVIQRHEGLNRSGLRLCEDAEGKHRPRQQGSQLLQRHHLVVGQTGQLRGRVDLACVEEDGQQEGPHVFHQLDGIVDLQEDEHEVPLLLLGDEVHLVQLRHNSIPAVREYHPLRHRSVLQAGDDIAAAAVAEGSRQAGCLRAPPLLLRLTHQRQRPDLIQRRRRVAQGSRQQVLLLQRTGGRMPRRRHPHAALVADCPSDVGGSVLGDAAVPHIGGALVEVVAQLLEVTDDAQVQPHQPLQRSKDCADHRVEDAGVYEGEQEGWQPPCQHQHNVSIRTLVGVRPSGQPTAAPEALHGGLQCPYHHEVVEAHLESQHGNPEQDVG